MSMTAIIVDAHLTSALATIRSLGKCGIRVVTAGERGTAIGRFSRYSHRFFRYQNPLTNKEAFITTLVKEVVKESRLVLWYTFSDATFTGITEACERGTLHGVLPAPHFETIDTVLNKQSLAAQARAVGIQTPKEFNISQKEQLRYPVIIKPRRTCSWKGTIGFFGTARRIDSTQDLQTAYDAILLNAGEPPLIQEMIRGEEYGVSVICDHGTIRALFAHRRLRSLSALGGASTLRESVPISEEMKTVAERLISVLKWHGVAMIELKKDSVSGTYVLIEMNTRFWGSLPLAIMAGVDFPFLYYQLATNSLADPPTSYRIGIKARHAIADLKHGRLFEQNTYSDVFSLQDPLPVVMEPIDAFIAFWQKRTNLTLGNVSGPQSGQ